MKYQPFTDESFNIQFIPFQLSEILKLGIGFNARDLTYVPNEIVNGVHVKEATDNPFLIDNNGNVNHYQRELVWNEEDKANLIDSIYNYSDIGKFVVVRRDYDYIKKMIKLNHLNNLAFHELVDGKQRLNAIVDFMTDKFKDNNGRFYSEIDQVHKRRLWSYNKCTIAILEDATPIQIKRAFLNVNNTGKPMTKEHIQFIKSLNV